MTYMNYSYHHSQSSFYNGGRDWWDRVCAVDYSSSYCSYNARCNPDYVIDPCAANAIFGTEGADYANLTSSADLYFGLGGNDTIIGREGPDTIHGGAGDDYIEGNDANDLLVGGIGNGTIWGNSGNDTIDSPRAPLARLPCAGLSAKACSASIGSPTMIGIAKLRAIDTPAPSTSATAPR